MNFLFHRLIKGASARKLIPSLLSAGLVVSTGSAFAVEDVLDTPSVSSAKAAKHLLLDIEKVEGRLVAVGARGHIVYSDNKGASWTQAQVPVSSMLTAVDFVDDKKGWAVGHGGIILHSNDGGLSWQKQFDGDQANQSIIERAAAYVAKVEADLDKVGEDEDLEYELEEAEYALEDAQIDAEIGPAKPFLDVQFLDENRGFAVGAYGFLFATKDGGVTWENQGGRLDNLDNFHLNSIEQLNGGNLLIVGEAGVMFLSRDNGSSWVSLDSPYDGSFFGVLALREKNTALAFGLRGNLFRTENAGRSWRKLNSNTDSSLMAGDIDGDRKITITGNAGAVIISRDGGRTFDAYAREDRLGHTAVAYVSDKRVALVGESGVELVKPSGKSL